MTYYGLNNPDGRNDVIICTVLGIFSTMTTILRFLSRRLLGAVYMLDDYLALGATVSAFVYPAAIQLIPLSLMTNTCFKKIMMIVNLCLHVTSS
jgi:hypothetical protein